MKVLIYVLLITSANLVAKSKLDSYCQNIFNKIKYESNENLKEKYPEFLSVDDDIVKIKCLLRINDSAIEQFILDNQGVILVKAGNIWAIEIPVTKLEMIIENSYIEQVSFAKTHSLHNQKSRISTNTNPLHKGIDSPVLKGRGVLVGVCDTGIDLDHPDFIADDTTRIKYLWDISDKSGENIPTGFTMGREFNSFEINGYFCTQVDTYGHGTHVAGTAAGNGNGHPDYIGIAPHSDILFVKSAYDINATQFIEEVDVLSAISWVFTKAEELGQPVVVNMSFGWMFGPHDGTSLLAEGLSNLTGPGKILVASAGNSAGYQLHTGTDYDTDEYYETLIYPYISMCHFIPNLCPKNSNYFATGIDMWHTVNSIDSVYITALENNIYEDKYIAISTNKYGADDIVSLDTLFHNHEIIGFIDMDVTSNIHDENSGNTLILIHNNGYNGIAIKDKIWSVKFKTGSKGKLDAWSFKPVPFFKDKYTPDKSVIQLLPDSYMSIASPASGKKVISVGSYVSLNEYIDDNGEEFKYDTDLGNLSNFSSRGPFRDGRIGPMVVAPGDRVISSISNDNESAYDNSAIVKEYYVAKRGTSMSAPVVTGIIALMLEVKPDLTFEEVSQILKISSKQDSFTGAIPNNDYGYGKIDAYAAIKAIISSNVSRYTDIDNKVKVYPVPATDRLYLENIEPNMQLVIFDENGKALLSPNSDSVLDVSELASGIYFLNVRQEMNSYAIKFVVNK